MLATKLITKGLSIVNPACGSRGALLILLCFVFSFYQKHFPEKEEYPRVIKYVSGHLNRDPAYNIFFIYRANLLATSES